MKRIERKKLKKQVFELWKQTKSNGKRLWEKQEIAQLLEIDRSTVARWLEEVGVKINKHKSKLPLDNT